MAIGDDATAAGFALVPNTGDPGRVSLGAQEINRTRDYVAQVKDIIPVGIPANQTAAGISFGTAAPNNADGKPNGSIYLMILP
jgi:hypothetical protein